jgi:hypothetical protein
MIYWRLLSKINYFFLACICKLTTWDKNGPCAHTYDICMEYRIFFLWILPKNQFFYLNMKNQIIYFLHLSSARSFFYKFWQQKLIKKNIFLRDVLKFIQFPLLDPLTRENINLNFHFPKTIPVKIGLIWISNFEEY